MSHYWSLGCVQCKIDGSRAVCGGINHGDADWPIIVKIWPEIKRVFEILKAANSYVSAEITILGYCDDSIWDFLSIHEKHGIVMCSEYGDSPEHPNVILIAPSGSHELSAADSSTVIP